MIGFGDLKELASAVGVPALSVIGFIAAIEYGVLPSITRTIDANVKIVTGKMDHNLEMHDANAKSLTTVMKQHNEQVAILNRALMEICLNTAKNEARAYRCAELNHTLVEKE